MKPQPHPDTRAHRAAGRAAPAARSALEEGFPVNGRRTPPTVPHRRYPSLSDDGQPWFPRGRWPRRSETRPPSAITAREGIPAEFPYVRVIAFAGIIAIIAALVANA